MERGIWLKSLTHGGGYETEMEKAKKSAAVV